jgi:hypothetical protein
MTASRFPLSKFESNSKNSSSEVFAFNLFAFKQSGFMPVNSKSSDRCERQPENYFIEASDLSPKRSIRSLSYLNFPQS